MHHNHATFSRSARWDLNPKPIAYRAIALTIELREENSLSVKLKLFHQF